MSLPLATPAALALHNTFRASVRELGRGLVKCIHYLSVIHRRKIHRALGHATIAGYAAATAGFSRDQTDAFLALGRRLAAFPEVGKALSRGDLSWSKARLIVERASPADERRWLSEATTKSVAALKSDLEAADPGRTTQRVEPEDAAGSLQGPEDPTPRDVGAESAAIDAPQGTRPAARTPAADAVADHRCHVTYTFSPEQYALWSVLHESLRKAGRREERADLILAGLEALSGAEAASRDGAKARYLVRLRRCPECGVGELDTARGSMPAPRPLLESTHCDAVVEPVDGARRSIVGPKLRRLVLERDGYRCQAPGCGRSAFLEIHHRVPVARGGATVVENLVVLCSACHRGLHLREVALIDDLKQADDV